MDDNNAAMSSRKRNRASIVCGFCRKRKVKCDRQVPCSTCVKYGNKECHYSNHEKEKANTNLMGELNNLKAKLHTIEGMIGNNVDSSSLSTNDSSLSYNKVDSSDETSSTKHESYSDSSSTAISTPSDFSSEEISLFDGHSGIIEKFAFSRRYHGIFNWVTFSKLDPVSEVISGNIHSIILNHLKKVFSVDGDQEKSGKVFSEKVMAELNLTAMKKNNSCVAASNGIDLIDQRAKKLGVVFYDWGGYGGVHLTERIKLILPAKVVIWKLIRRYFDALYPFFPYIDENTFRGQVISVIGPESYENEKVEQLNIRTKLDFAVSGILLIVLRLSYLSLFSGVLAASEAEFLRSDSSVGFEEKQFLINNPINIDAVPIAKDCLFSFNMLDIASLHVLQLALYLKIYASFAPEEGDGNFVGTSQIFNGIAVQMAMDLGLNRDPDCYPAGLQDEKVNNLSRKIWHGILQIDMMFSLATGRPLVVDVTCSDTKLPFYKPGNENLNDIEKEKEVLLAFKNFFNYYEPLRDITRLVLNVRTKFRVGDLMSKLTSLDNALKSQRDKMTSLTSEHIFSSVFAVGETMDVLIYLNVRVFLLSNYFHMFVHYDKLRRFDISFYFLRKIFSESIFDMLPFMNRILDISNKKFNHVIDLIIIPTLECGIHKSCLIVTALIARTYFVKYHYEKTVSLSGFGGADQKYLSLLVDVQSKLELCFRSLCDLFNKLSGRYYYAWRTGKIYNIISGIITSKTLSEKMGSPDFKYKPEIPIFELQELNDVLADGINALRSSTMAENSSSTSEANNKDPNKLQFDPANPGGEMQESSCTLSSDEIDNFWLQMMKKLKTNTSFAYDSPQYRDPSFDINSHPSELLNTEVSEMQNLIDFSIFNQDADVFSSDFFDNKEFQF
ncbi:Piso0_005122 [Millerozyma farinosa CBS 7064]|uniref:Piso0_005122 protein n=1 Tax=Pichia sorbitophila (strain ATCC MYA-4447 / BCRC 22081 / CBS 7064 / NBRC 10061 / NRRL Y-12695) TaxID=559304 RepID=G8Y4A3_PICSO|nr:Piso0_005122 [Millerozyma farinosa CBS 7064]